MEQREYPDSVMTDKGMVRISTMDPSRVLTIQGRKVVAGDIPLTTFTLECGHMGRGIALQLRDLVFCDTCSGPKNVAQVNG